jgi:hypothetical protein
VSAVTSIVIEIVTGTALGTALIGTAVIGTAVIGTAVIGTAMIGTVMIGVATATAVIGIATSAATGAGNRSSHQLNMNSEAGAAQR